jgi:hypothetical protein
MRWLLASTAIALLFSLSPASAMCGGDGQQAGAGGMCGASGGPMKQMSDWPVAPQAQPQQPRTGMGMGCPCCRNMAMMGGMKADDPHKGMEMPKQ